MKVLSAIALVLTMALLGLSYVARANSLPYGAAKLNPNVYKLAVTAYENAIKSGIKDDKGILTVIDYSLPSTAKRMWVIDMKHHKTLYNTLVAHATNSGANYATRFSNRSGSHLSSLGLFETTVTYNSSHRGYSLRINGLEPGFNDNALRRGVVIHGAPYVRQSFIDQNGRLGRSWGCPALDDRISSQVIDVIKDHTLVFAYYPDKNWLSHSTYL